jgi:cytochrome c-type biogenesis protein CcmH/NrfF
MTAVEFLVNQLEQNKFITESQIHIAKEMEKEQICEAYEDGYSDSDNTFELNKEYYNETFKK